jgi:hypothetical protein
MAGFVYEMMEELEEKIKVVIEAIPKSRLIAAFRDWQKRIDEYIKNKKLASNKLLCYVFNSRIFLLEIESPEI